jgi:peptidoglycan hydrolase CwlO-like protein
MARLNGNSTRVLAIIMAVGMAVSLTYSIVTRGATDKIEACAQAITALDKDQTGKHADLDRWMQSVDKSLQEINRKLDRDRR